MNSLLPSDSSFRILREPWGALPDGREVFLYRLVSPSGMMLEISNLGGIITRLTAPDREGRFADVVLGFDSVDGYLSDPCFIGVLAGRVANRIAAGRFALDGDEFSLELNNGPNHLHGGSEGFHTQLWKVESIEMDGGAGFRLHHRSPDGHGGYPGTLDVEVVYLVTADQRLAIRYQARTDSTTPVNLTHHAYFNLIGNSTASVENHQLMIAADRYTPVTPSLIPTGELKSVGGTPFDFRSMTRIGDVIQDDDPQIALAGGFDHNWVLSGRAGELTLAARVHEPESGRILEVHTTEPGMQLFTANFGDLSFPGKEGQVIRERSGFCLETQHFPDAPNQPGFPSILLHAEQTYRSETVFAFTTDSVDD